MEGHVSPTGTKRISPVRGRYLMSVPSYSMCSKLKMQARKLLCKAVSQRPNMRHEAPDLQQTQSAIPVLVWRPALQSVPNAVPHRLGQVFDFRRQVCPNLDRRVNADSEDQNSRLMVSGSRHQRATLTLMLVPVGP